MNVIVSPATTGSGAAVIATPTSVRRVTGTAIEAVLFCISRSMAGVVAATEALLTSVPVCVGVTTIVTSDTV